MKLKLANQTQEKNCSSCCYELKGKQEVIKCESWCKKHHSSNRKDYSLKDISLDSLE